MAERPSHIAYVVQDAPEGSDRKGIWREVGALWPIRGGFKLRIHDQFSIAGDIVITERKEREETADRPASPAQRPAGRSGPR